MYTAGSFDEALAYVKLISAPFGQLSEAQWQHLTETSIVQRADGRWSFRYDPRIADPFKAAFVDKDIDLWPVYEAVRCPALALRGAAPADAPALPLPGLATSTPGAWTRPST